MIKKINDFLKFFPFIISDSFKNFFLYLSYIEDIILKKKISNIFYKRVIVCGYPRSGTTFLTTILHKHEDIVSYQYKDIPFIFTIYFWNKFNNLYYYGAKKILRSHKDKISIDINSPDSFEEILWSSFIENYRDGGFKKILNENYNNKTFEKFIENQIKKLIYVRNNSSFYLSKGNYFIFRLKYIEKINPGSKHVLCIRNPIDQCLSAVRTNKIFYENYNTNNYYNKETDFLCHFEFGYRKKNIFENNEFINEKPKDFDVNYKYYLSEWIYTYEFVLNEYLQDSNFKNKILIVNYDKLDKNILNKIFNFCILKPSNKTLKYFEDNFSPVKNKNSDILSIDKDIKKSKLEDQALKLFNKIINNYHIL